MNIPLATAAKRFGISRPTLYRWVDNGWLKRDNKKRVDCTRIEDIIKAQRQNRPAGRKLGYRPHPRLLLRVPSATFPKPDIKRVQIIIDEWKAIKNDRARFLVLTALLPPELIEKVQEYSKKLAPTR